MSEEAMATLVEEDLSMHNKPLSIFAYLFIILLQNVNNQINNIHLPEGHRANTVWSAWDQHFLW